jgi:hypothetical protein
MKLAEGFVTAAVVIPRNSLVVGGEAEQGREGGAAAGEGLADSACQECRNAIVRGTCVILRRHGDIDLVSGVDRDFSCRLFTHAPGAIPSSPT